MESTQILPVTTQKAYSRASRECPHRISQQSPRHRPAATHRIIDAPKIILERRTLLIKAAAALTAAATAAARPAAADEQRTSSTGLVEFTASSFSLRRPETWEQIDKPGAEVLFRDPNHHSSTLGITVLPVRIESLAEFGGLDQVGQRLLDAERAKESTLSVVMVDAAVREAPAGPVYDFEYELESTRGRKRILSTVTVVDNKLYIANGALSCSKQSCDAVTDDAVLLRRATRSLQVQQ